MKNYSKIIIITVILAVFIGLVGINCYAAADPITVYVTTTNGELVWAQLPVTVTDADGDGSITVNDALLCAHEANYPGGAAAGYKSEVSEFGRSLDKLLGVENGGSYGYYVNNASVASLVEKIKDGDYINAFVYSDTKGFSDMFCYFNVHTVSVPVGTEFSLTLSGLGFDANWATVIKPVSGAKIIIDGKDSGYKTDADGKVTLTLEDSKTHIISAISDTAVLVPPVCTVSAAASAQTGDPQLAFAALMYSAAVISALCAAFVAFRRNNAYEK